MATAGRSRINNAKFACRIEEIGFGIADREKDVFLSR